MGVDMLSPWGSFFTYQLMLYSAVLLTMYFGGRIVLHWHVRVHYVRKVCTFLFLFYALRLEHLYPFHQVPYVDLLTTIGWVACFGLLSLRHNIPVLATCFSAVDRPEDRPHTNRWIMAEFLGNYLTMQACIALYAHFHLPNLIWLSFLTVTFGDGLAEPVGFRWGKHTYTTRALYGGGRHVRSLEGSACVYVITLLILGIFHHAFSPLQWLVASLIVPPLATLAEAVSPHTCDGPMIHAAMTVSLAFILLFC